MDLNFIDSVQFRLVLEVLSFLIRLIATSLVFIQYSLNKNTFLKYLTMSFFIFFIQCVFMQTCFFYAIITNQGLPEVFMPMFDHILKIVGYGFLVYAFVFFSPKPNLKVKTVFKVNLLIIGILSVFFWYCWYQYLLIAPIEEQKFSFYWVDLVYEVLITILLIYGLYLVLKSTGSLKKPFIGGFIVLILKQVLHITNIVLAHNTITPILLVERVLLIPFYYIIIVSVHYKVVREINEANKEKAVLNQQIFDSTIQALVGSLELKDVYTKGHAGRVTEYCMLIGKHLGMSVQEMRDLYYGALLHDIGKIGMPEEILNKSKSLSKDELAHSKKHAVDGSSVVEGLEHLQHIAPTIKYHHERWDGEGYPEKLQGNSIPLHARVVAVADAFDAMVTDRPYRSSLSREDAIIELVKERGKQFDPQIIDVFIKCLTKT